MRVLAIDHGDARCGCAISDPTGTIVDAARHDLPPEPEALAALARERGAEAVVVGLPVSLDGSEGAQAEAARAFAAALDELRRRPGRHLRRAPDHADGVGQPPLRLRGGGGLARRRAPARGLPARAGGAPVSDGSRQPPRRPVRHERPGGGRARAPASAARGQAPRARRARRRWPSASAGPSTAPRRRVATRSSRAASGSSSNPSRRPTRRSRRRSVARTRPQPPPGAAAPARVHHETDEFAPPAPVTVGALRRPRAAARRPRASGDGGAHRRRRPLLGRALATPPCSPWWRSWWSSPAAATPCPS